MKILRLTGSAPERWSIELHPRLTIVHGLSPAVAAAVRDAVDAVVQARVSGPSLAAAGLSGSVAIGDEVVALEDLSDRAPGLVPATPMTAADLMSPSALLAGDRRRSLTEATERAEAALAAAEADLAAARGEWELATQARTTRLRAGWVERQDAVAVLRGARARLADAVAGATPPAPPSIPRAASPEVLSLAAARVEAALVAHQAARAALAEAEQIAARPVAASGGVELDALRRELAEAEATAAAPEPAVATVAQRDALVEQRAQLMEHAATLAPSSPSTERVVAALSAAEAHRGIEAVEAARVAVEWERVRDLVAMAEAPPSSNGSSALFGPSVEAPPPSIFGGSAPAGTEPGAIPADLAAKVAAARERVVAAHRELEEAIGSGPVDAAEVEALEAAHAEVLAAWEGSERRIGVGKARRRLEDAQLAEREVLARMGFASYTEFMVSGRASGLPPQVDPEQARREVMFAEEALRSAEAEVEAALAAAGPAAPPTPAAPAASSVPSHLVETMAALRSRAADLLGEDPGDDVATRLRERIATDPVSDLRLALDEVGLPLGEVMSRDEVLARARAWIGRNDDVAQQSAAVAARRVEVEDALARVDAAEGAHVAWEAAQRRRDQLRAAVAEAESTVGTDASAAERVERDRAELVRAESDLAEAEATLAELQSRGAGSDPAPAPATTVDVDLAALEAEARDAQTALDVAVAHLLQPAGSEADAESDARLGAAEARVALAQIELDGLRRVAASRARPASDRRSGTDLDSAIWRILSRMASHRAATVDGGPGPTPLLLVDPFEGLSETEVRRMAEALVGPASAVQTIVMTARPEVVAWARGLPAERVGLVGSAAAGASRSA